MSNYEHVRQLSQVLLKDEATYTREIIREKAQIAIAMYSASKKSSVEIDLEKLVRELQSQHNIWIGKGHILDDNRQDQKPWLADSKNDIEWSFWQRYYHYLEEKSWSPATIDSLEELTDKILDRLGNPNRNGTWDRRGMVVGQVQSGKTANYTGLICKAVDAGYKLIIVLAGMQNGLRSQAQLRLDEGFLGFDSQVDRAYEEGNRKGVGLIPTEKKLIVNSATSSSNQGDFGRNISNQFNVTPGGGDPLLFVVKKNKSVLQNLFRWALSQGEKDSSGKKVVRDVPLLIIDDEADNASINTNAPELDSNGKVVEELDVSAINGLIRKTLHSFEQSSYIGYTATPFANIFIFPNNDLKNREYGEDLFPRSFIVNLPTPSNYIGPVQVFGLNINENSNLVASEGLPIIRSIDDHESWIPHGHKKEHEPSSSLPISLQEAIKAFILACAVKIARGKEKEHNSMLVHVTRFTDVQNKVAEQVKKELFALQRKLKDKDNNSFHLFTQEFKNLWESDFLPTTQETIQIIKDPEICLISWEKVQNCLNQAASKIQVREINGTAKDVLDYEDHKSNGLSVIAIGGDKLSRGLTLEGLTISYYLRPAKMYDTLMQMGRWFGYRPGYADICRIYTTDELVEWYEHITVATEELRQDFDYMANSGETPENFGLKVRTHPQGLKITGLNKMAASRRMNLSFAGTISETTIFHKNANINQENFAATEDFIENLGLHNNQENDNYIWSNISAENIINFISVYRPHDKCKVAKTVILTRYIQTQRLIGELTSWTVILISNKRANNKASIANKKIGLIQRKPAKSSNHEEYRIRKSRLLSPTDEWLDLPKPIRNEIMKETRELRKKSGKPISSSNTPNGKIIREKRFSSNGLLLLYPLDPTDIDSEIPIIGFAISFPSSNTAQTIEYKVNEIYSEAELNQLNFS